MRMAIEFIAGVALIPVIFFLTGKWRVLGGSIKEKQPSPISMRNFHRVFGPGVLFFGSWLVASYAEAFYLANLPLVHDTIKTATVGG